MKWRRVNAKLNLYKRVQNGNFNLYFKPMPVHIQVLSIHLYIEMESNGNYFAKLIANYEHARELNRLPVINNVCVRYKL